MKALLRLWKQRQEDAGVVDEFTSGEYVHSSALAPPSSRVEDERLAEESDLQRTLPSYSPLPASGHFIRLLDIQPGPRGTFLQCNLRVASLSSQPSYKALSYAWVDETVNASSRKDLPIICDQNVILVSRNLHAALEVFRPIKSILTLWVDFLCINQQDTEERTQQVGIMRDIYLNCEEVLIWLGPNVGGDFLGVNDETADSAVVTWHNDSRDEDMMCWYTNCFNEYESHGEHTMPLLWARDIFGAFAVLRRLAEGSSLDHCRFYRSSITSSKQLSWSSLVQKGIWAIVDASWWQRTWVIQETVLPRKATVYLGLMSALWAMFASAAATYVQQLATADLKGLSQGLDNGGDPLLLLAKSVLDLEFVRASRTEGTQLPMLSMLRRFRVKRSSDPRDKVFALLGLASEQVQQSMKPDYSLTVLQVMRMTTIAVLVESRGLDPLAGRVLGPTASPSWVTNWHEFPAGNERERLDCLRLYNASGGDQSGIMIRLHGPFLQLQGCVVSKIGRVGVRAPDGGFERLRNFVGKWQDMLSHSLVLPVREKSFESFWKTITADTLYVESSRRPSTSLLAQESRYLRTSSCPNVDVSAAAQAWKSDDTATRHRKTTFGPAGLLKAYVPPEELTALINGFHYAVNTASGGRRFFVTQNGLMGIGPARLDQGDEVHIVLGSRVPLILRRRRFPRGCAQDAQFGGSEGVQSSIGACNKLHYKTYALVGDAYVHGVMDGEFSSGLKESQKIYIH
ncbi:heterokaryon incompatibility protein-domain-containing protein [Clohesyomyces aquaticus]|uniref:Heterokaryon incompatibility protein-domain-containing protein n=1 Tax=Clohesyomyces aquaticus TaxID=1231657 RepID=A0A1Y1ZUA5_9PLEO|nr:heterokaryon incompatibility protein-domain-containing protein [Clohesyomyces aquaticus]